MEYADSFDKLMEQHLKDVDERQAHTETMKLLPSTTPADLRPESASFLAKAIQRLQDNSIPPDIKIYKTVDSGREYRHRVKHFRGADSIVKTTYKEHVHVDNGWIIEERSGKDSEGWNKHEFTILSTAKCLVTIPPVNFPTKLKVNTPAKRETTMFGSPKVHESDPQKAMPVAPGTCLIDPKYFLPVDLDQYFDCLAVRTAGRPHFQCDWDH